MLNIRIIILSSIFVLGQCPQAYSQTMPSEYRQESINTSLSNDTQNQK